ncbi:interferon-induced very large GTPase 1-like isoform X1 [Thunnus albacares]|uniref:interferon-induced very large GTPase 1-like isoform X1 n=1 Tax=Thunnus albacares TaxID=8236 RepID=UPI001CF6BBA4|nr:interferon-induced very large GTPase 1-like isoform X1 [Thunnus albacares]
METEDHDNTAAGGEPEVEFENPPVANDKACTAVEELEKSETEAERDPVNEPSEAEHSERNDETTSGESEITVEVPTASDKKAGEADDVKEVHDENISDISEQTAGESDRLECTSQSVAREIKELTTDRTLVLVGDTNSIEIGSNNLLLDHDVQTNEEQFSHKLYDLFGRRIYVINMLGLQNIDKFPLKRGIHAFLLLLQNGLHISQYSSGVQWLEKTFGKGSLPYLLTVVTHKTDEKCESALTELEANSGEKRYLTCNNSMMDVNDIIALFKNIDDLVSENDPHCYSGLMCDDKDQLDPKSQEEERINSSVSQQNQTVDESEKNASAIKLKCHPVTQPGDAEHSEKNDGSTTSDGKPQDKSVKTSAPNEKACTAVEELEKSETEAKCDPVNDPSEAEHSERNNETTSGESEITVEVPTASDKKVDESEKNASAIKLKCHPVTEPGDAEHSEKNDGSTTSDGKPQDKSVKTSAPNEKACTAVEELEESETEAERDPVNEPNEAEHSERNNETTSGESEITVEVPTASDKKVDESDKNASAIKLKCHPVTEPGDAEHSEKSDGSTTSHGEPQDKSVKTSAPNEKACTAVEELEESETEAERDPVNEPNEAEHSERNNETTSGESEITVEVPTASDKKVDESDKNASAIKLKCHPVTEPGDAEHSEKSDGSTTSHGEPQDKSVKTSAPNEKACTAVEELEKSETEVKCDPVDEPSEAEHSERNNETTSGESEITVEVPTASHKKAGEADEVKEVHDENSSDISEQTAGESDRLECTSQSVAREIKELTTDLTLVLVGDTNSIEIGSNNLLLDRDVQTNEAQFSHKLYDLFGRRIYVINMLGLQNIDKFPLKRGIHAFLLLLQNGLHISQYSSGVQWLEKTFGKGSLPYLLTVVTHKSDEKCESVLTELEANSAEKRYLTCNNSMMDVNEIIALLKNIDDLVSENDPHCYSGLMYDDKDHLDPKSQEEERINSSVSQQNQTVDESEKNASAIKLKCHPVTEPGDAEHSEKNDGSTTSDGEPQDKSVKTSAPSEKGTLHTDADGNKDKKSEKIFEEKRTEQYQREFKTLLRRLHLQQKLTPADFLRISQPVKQQHDTSEKDLAHTFLQRLMMLDYRARYIPVKQDSPEMSCTKPLNTVTEEEEEEEEEEDDDFANFSTSVDSLKPKQSHVHPMDVQMAVFHCSDSFLKQNMITKLSQCQYAVPLLVPDPVKMDIKCPLWTFRQIRKSWKITQTKDDSNIITMKSMPICKAKTPMVSFFRLGSLSRSKSELINTLINDRHSTFFHRNCKGSTKSRHLMDGVAEIAWYCPAGKHDDAFTDCIAFCNLHGDALLIEEQCKTLMEKSSVNVVLVQTLNKSHKSWTVVSALLKATKPLICLIVDDDCGAVETKEGKYKMGLKDRSQSDVGEELKEIIGKILSGPHTSFQLETMAKVSGIRVDEDDSVYQKGKSAAMTIVNLLQKMDVSKIKDKYLPCRGQLWHDWCKTNKEQYRLKGHIEKEKCEKQQELEIIRQKQRDASSSELIKLFIESLSSLPLEDKEYFLKWLQILLDSLSTDDLSSILQEYDEKWSEVLDLKKRGKSDQLIRKQTELEKISAKLQSATFGLEHIFREIGQIYEAHKSLKKQTKQKEIDWSKYPELAAELMIAGHPMELMDGDAGYVPLTWISSLLDEVINKLGDKRIFVLSVLGLQSSGKSTMLNAMFGLQFAVSAGRCTKGAFMQLVKVSEKMKMKDFKFDYVLVVDTEGLRALELAGNASLHHDNELATFVVGLGNMTLINIFGENPADMQDVLQIVVQAIMRMKKVKLSPSCLFVHQNVTDIGAAEKNMDGKRRLQEKLDEMAKLAAKEEVYDAECFNDIIVFDVQKDVKYFAQLWEGSPPMAPPNPGYSESIQDLKNFILSKASQSAGTTLSKFKSNIKDLWAALLKENFVFSFKNTLEIAVYRKLEVQYGNWTWALRSNMLTIENQLYNRIENEKLEKVDHSYLLKKQSKTYEEVKKDMKKYFDDDRDKEILAQWRSRFEIKIKEFHDERVGGVKRKLDEVIQQKNACKKLDDKKAEFEKMLLQKSEELAQQLKDKAKDEEELKRQFDGVWSGLVAELTGDIKPIKDITLEDEKKFILDELSIEWSLIDDSKSSESYKKISTMGDYFKYVTLNNHEELCDKSQQSQDGKKANKKTKEQEGWRTWFLQKFWRSGSTQQEEPCKSSEKFSFEENQLITSLINNVAQQSIGIIQGKPVASRGYSQTYLQEVAKNVKDKVTEFENTRKYTLKKEFTVDLLLYVLEMVGSKLLESHNKFKTKNDAVTFVESKKIQYYSIFRSFCKGNSSAVVLGELICDKLKVSTVEAVCNKTALDLAGEMRCNSPAFSGNRLNLEKHVLKSLAEKEDFDSYMNYIRHPRKQAEIFIREEVKKYIFTEHKAKTLNILKKNVDDIEKLVIQALFTATERVKTERGDTDMWLKEFSSLLKENDKLTFNTICCQNFSDIENFDFLKEEIQKGLRPIIQDLRRLSLDKMQEFRLKPDQILIDQLCKCCWVKCPFCSAVCTNTVEDHSPDDHSVPFHRSTAVTGRYYRNTDELSIEFCTTKVASDLHFCLHADSDESIPYKKYRTGGPKYANWRIDYDESKLKYWKWFVCRFQEQLEDHYKSKFKGRGEIPSEWKTHSKEEAIKSLDEMCE